jgi:hypothetical protein
LEGVTRGILFEKINSHKIAAAPVFVTRQLDE